MGGSEETMTSAFFCEVAGCLFAGVGSVCVDWGNGESWKLSVRNGRVGPHFLNSVRTSKTNIPEDGFILFESDT